jgi:putative copper export protein
VTLGGWEILEVLAKAATYATTFGAAGGVMFLNHQGSLLASEVRCEVRRSVCKLALAALAASAVYIDVTAAAMSGDLHGFIDFDLVSMVAQSGEWRALLARTLGLIAAVAAASTSPKRGALSLVGAVAAATSFAWVGHVHAQRSAWLATASAVHLASVAFWVGALWPLLITLRRSDGKRAAQAVMRFAAGAVAVVGLLVLAGILLLATLVGHWAALWQSDYGRSFLAKLALVAALLSVAALNKWRFTPRLRTNDPRAIRALRLSIRLEMVLAILILTVTAGLTTVSGPPTLE